jgi:hypothetical protein
MKATSVKRKQQVSNESNKRQTKATSAKQKQQASNASNKRQTQATSVKRTQRMKATCIKRKQEVCKVHTFMSPFWRWVMPCSRRVTCTQE